MCDMSFILITVYFTGYAYGNTNLLNYVPHVPSCLRSIRTSRTFVSYAFSRLMRLLALRALHTLFARLKIFLEWICSLSKTFNFRTVKGTTSCTVFMRVKNRHQTFLRWGPFLSVFKTQNQFKVFVLFFLSCQP